MYIPSEIIILFFLISFLVYTMPDVLVVFSKTFYGKASLILLMILTTLYNPTGGLLIAMLIIFLSEFNYTFNNRSFYEEFNAFSNADKITSAPPKKGAAAAAGTEEDMEEEDMEEEEEEEEEEEDMEEEDTEENTPENFRKNYCDNDELRDDDGNVVELSDMSTVFPQLKFKKAECNPCDTKCVFTITDGNEQIETEEELKSKDSANFGVSRRDTSEDGEESSDRSSDGDGTNWWDHKYQLTFSRI
jgi:hypothetical protein